MKKVYMILAGLAMMSSSVFAQHAVEEYYMTASDVSIEPGETADLKIDLTSPEVLASASFSVAFPEGIKVYWGYDEDLEEDAYIVSASSDLMKKSFTKNVFVKDDGSFGVAIYNTSGGTFKAASGWLITLTLECPEDATPGTYDCKLEKCDGDTEESNLVAKNGWADGTYFADAPFKITIGPATGIENVTVADGENAPIYNIAGQKVGKDYKGLVIINGKKIIKK